MKMSFQLCLLIIVTTSVASHEFELGVSEQTGLKRVSRSTNETISSQFDCDQFSNCTSCLSLDHPCVWCFNYGRCTYNAGPICSDEMIRGRSEFCPRIISTTGSNEILLPAGTKKSVQVKAKIDQFHFLTQLRFRCFFEIESQKIYVDARLLGDTLYCDSFEFNYRSNATYLKVPFNIVYGFMDGKSLDNTENLHVLIYRCNADPNTIENCASLAPKFACSWCPRKNSCEMAVDCHEDISRESIGERSELDHRNCDTGETCASCVSTDKTCNFCIDGFRCVSLADNECYHDFLEKGSSFCPRITNIAYDNILFIPGGTNKSISAEVQLVHQFLTHAHFKCQLEIGDQVEIVEARLLRNTIYCGNFRFPYETQASIVSAKFSIFWGHNKTLDNTKNMEAMIYRCSLLASSESTCSVLPGKFDCAWCAESNSCQITAQCPKMNQTEIERNFECQKFETCTSCVTAVAACSWCLDSNRCTGDINVNCSNEMFVTNSNHTNANLCPRITAVNGNKRTLIPDGKVVPVLRFKTENINEFLIQTRFHCRFNIEGRVQVVNARILADTVYCDGLKFRYLAHGPNATVPFAVTWGGANELGNPDDIEIVIYRCQEMADTAEKCAIFSQEYACRWCTASSTCELEHQCV